MVVPVNFSVSSQGNATMGNSCNHEHEEEIEEDIICCMILPKYILGLVSVVTVISSSLEFKRYSAVPD